MGNLGATMRSPQCSYASCCVTPVTNAKSAPSWSAASSSLPNRSRMGRGLLEALDCAGSKTNELGGLEDARALSEFAACRFEFLGIGVGTAQTLPYLASLANEVAI